MLDYKEAVRALQGLRKPVASKRDYVKRRQRLKSLQGLPDQPDKAYLYDWKGWPAFLCKWPRKEAISYRQAKGVVIRLKIDSQDDYQLKRHLNPMLPVDPSCSFKRAWTSWAAFCDPEELETGQEAPRGVRAQGSQGNPAKSPFSAI